MAATTSPTYTTDASFQAFAAAAFNPNPCSATAPTNLAAPTVAYNQVGLDWSGDCTNNTTYNVYRDSTLLAAGTGLSCNASMAFTDSTVVASTSYTYTVKGDNGTCLSGDSNAVPVTTPTYTTGTTTGTMTFSNIAMSSMDVAVSYTGDDDGNNGLTQFQYATDAGFTSPVNITGATRSGKSWVASVTGLTDSTIYYFRATFADTTGGVTGTNPVAGSQATTANTLMHKSGILGSKYPSWGTNYTCATCHDKNTAPNIKRIRATVGGVGLTNAAGTVVSGNALSATIASGPTANYADNATSNKVCDSCHGSTSIYKRGVSNTTSGTPAMITGATPPHPADADCIKCHLHNSGFKVKAGCIDCHNVGGAYQAATAAFTIVDTTGTALRGEAYGGHLRLTAAENLATVTDWNARCLACHDGHVNTNGVHIPENPAVGIDYLRGYIALGGTATSGTTEAEICWNCHDAKGVSEWGTNTDTNGGLNNYNFGTVYTGAAKTTATSRWIGSYWASANFTYKEGWLNNKPNTTDSVNGTANGGSTHAATTGAGTAKGVDAVASIRCSYCHDVHNTAAMTASWNATAKTNDPNGKPYLRGRWVGSPYREDGAPRQGQAGTYPAANTTTNPWGAVPRGSAAMGTVMGGYWIDQNSGNPIAPTYTATQFGGLCDLCHGATKDGAFAAAEIDALNQYDAAGVGWVSALNGHSNSVHGGTDSTLAARNIFLGRGGATTQDNQNTADHPYMGFFGTNVPGDANGGFRGGSSAWTYTPAMTSRPMDGDGWASTGWNNIAGRTLDWDGSTIDAAFHSFSCSKCHTPHASRLPALMITNCLDTKNNTWDNAFQVHGTSDTINAGRSISNWSSAQNCHRLGGNDPLDSRDTAADTSLSGNKGWNTVTPW
ncbi:MAG: fibronectin type III domain-containing protein [Desulfuromonadales bacterium]